MDEHHVVDKDITWSHLDLQGTGDTPTVLVPQVADIDLARLRPGYNSKCSLTQQCGIQVYVASLKMRYRRGWVASWCHSWRAVASVFEHHRFIGRDEVFPRQALGDAEDFRATEQF